MNMLCIKKNDFHGAILIKDNTWLVESALLMFVSLRKWPYFTYSSLVQKFWKKTLKVKLCQNLISQMKPFVWNAKFRQSQNLFKFSPLRYGNMNFELKFIVQKWKKYKTVVLKANCNTYFSARICHSVFLTSTSAV